MKIHHLGYLVKKHDKALKEFEKLGFEVTHDTVFDEYRGIDITFLARDGYVVEIVSPKEKDSVVSELFKKIGNSPYHICYETDDIEKSTAELSQNGYVMWEEPHEAVAMGGKRVCFLVHPFMGMIELVEAGE
jgi:methylmalonyl-CoA/ethylmalonyl-CoA epimerase